MLWRGTVGGTHSKMLGLGPQGPAFRGRTRRLFAQRDSRTVGMGTASGNLQKAMAGFERLAKETTGKSRAEKTCSINDGKCE